MAIIDYGPVGIVPKYAYDANTTYGFLEVVTADNCLFMSLKPANLGNALPTTTDVNQYWWRILDGRGTANAQAKADLAEAAAGRASAAAELAEQTDVATLQAGFSAALTVIQAQIQGIQTALQNLGTTSAVLIDSEDGYKVSGQPIMTLGTGAPSAVPLAVGCFYFDTANRALYVSKAVTGSTSDWAQVA